jgi:hypothetical protein
MIRPSAVDAVLLNEAAERLGYPFATQSALDTAIRKANYLPDSGELDCRREDGTSIAICLRDDEFTRWWSSEGLATTPEVDLCSNNDATNTSTCIQRGSRDFWAWIARWNARRFEESHNPEQIYAGRDRELDYGNFVHISCNTNPDTYTAMCGNDGTYVDAITGQQTNLTKGALVQVGDASSSGPCVTPEDCYYLHLYPLWRVDNISKASYKSNETYNATKSIWSTDYVNSSFFNTTTNDTEIMTSPVLTESTIKVLAWRIVTHFSTNFTLSPAWDGDSNDVPRGRCCHPDSAPSLPNITLPSYVKQGQLVHVVRTFPTNK